MSSVDKLPDVQGLPDGRGVAVAEAGIAGLRYPIVVLDEHCAKQETTGTLSMSVEVPATDKGAHMSRFIEVLEDWVGELTVRTAPHLLRSLADRMGSRRARVQVDFPYFIERRAPVTGSRGLLDVDCRFDCHLEDDRFDFVMSVTTPVATVCPCSKAISDYGAHNQRGRVTITVRPSTNSGEHEFIWVEELVALAERSASAPLYPVLKRPDERYVTMLAFDNPVFVEDVVRAVALSLSEDARVRHFAVEAVNDESIHNHAAFARLGAVHPLRGSQL